MTVRELIATFRPFVQPHSWRMAAGTALVLAGTATGLLRPWPLKYLFDNVLAGDATPASARVALLLVAAAIAAIAAADGAFKALRRYILGAAGQKVGFGIQTAVYDRLQHLSLTFHDKYATGELITRITKDVDNVQTLATETLVEAGSHALKLVGIVIVTYWLDWRLGLAMLILAPILLLASTRYRRRVHAAEQEAREREGEMTSVAQETLSAMRLVKAYGRESLETTRFTTHARQWTGAAVRVLRTEAVLGAVVDALVAVVIAGLVWLAAAQVLAGAITVGVLVIFISYLREFYDPVGSLSKLAGRISRIRVRAERIADVLRETPTVRDLPGATPAPRLRGRIEFEHVTFGYVPTEPVLKDVSFRVEPGQVVALAGPTGSGKTTVAALVARLYDPSHGRVLIDGRDVRSYTLASLRPQIAWLLQDSILFRATVWDNIAYGRPDATREEIIAAAKTANAHGFIMALPNGYDSLIGERGETLSGGQRQLIAIARAIIRDAPILILDEPTAGLDAASQRIVRDALERLVRGRTALLISHDVENLRLADVILVLENGRVVDRGSYRELLASGRRFADDAR